MATLGYTESFLKSCPEHKLPKNEHVETADGRSVKMQYIPDVSLMFEDRELQGVRIFFARGTTMRSLFGSDILKYFKRVIDYDSAHLVLTERDHVPALSVGETQIQIYALGSDKNLEGHGLTTSNLFCRNEGN